MYKHTCNVRESWLVVQSLYLDVAIGMVVELVAESLLALTACHTTSQAPLDDAYYWPDKSVQTTTTPSNNAKQAEGSNSQTPSNNAVVEYTNVQDTTVTIKIKR